MAVKLNLDLNVEVGLQWSLYQPSPEVKEVGKLMHAPLNDHVAGNGVEITRGLVSEYFYGH